MDCTYCDEGAPETATIRASVTVYPTDYEMRETSTRILCARCLDRLKNARRRDGNPLAKSFES